MAKAPARIEPQTPHAAITSVEQAPAPMSGPEPRTPSRSNTPCHSKPAPLPPLKNDARPFKNLR
jgi:hypothetical protein